MFCTKSMVEPKTPLFFRWNSIKEIISKHYTPTPTGSRPGEPSLPETPLHLTERYFRSYVLETEKKSCLTKVCTVCSRKKDSNEKKVQSMH